MVSTLGHGIVVALCSISEITTGDNSYLLEPSPWSSNLTTIAAKTEAGSAIAAASSVSDGKKSLEFSTSCDASSVVESLGSSVGPAGAAVRLVAHVVNHWLACGPVGA